jgi:O-antigen ligase
MEFFYYMRLPILFYLVLAAIENVRQMKILLLLMLLSFLWVGKGFYHTMGGRDTSHYSNALRDAGPLGYAGANGLAAFEVACTVFLIGPLACLGWKLHVRAAVLAAGAIGLLAVLFSYSRGSYLGLICSVTYAGIFKARILLVAMVLTLIAAPAILPSSVIERVAMTYDDSGQLENSATERLIIWEEAVDLFKRDPVVGVGYQGFSIHRQLDPIAASELTGVLRDTHNMYMRALIESGIIGLLILIALFVKLFLAGHALYRKAQDPFLRAVGLGFATMMISVILCNLFGDRWTYIEISGYTFTLAALVMRGQWIIRDTPISPPFSQPIQRDLRVKMAV